VNADQARAELAQIEPQAQALWERKEKLQEQIDAIIHEWQPLYSRVRELEIFIKMQEEIPKT